MSDGVKSTDIEVKSTDIEVKNTVFKVQSSDFEVQGTHTLPKKERIYLKKEIDILFKPGNARSFTDFPIRMVYRFVDRASVDEPQVKVLVSVAKKRLHHAVDRVRAKRQMREAYRLNKPQTHKKINIAFVWMANEPQPTALVHEKIKTLLGKLK